MAKKKTKPTGNLPEWMTDKGAKRKQNERSRKQERRHAESSGGVVQAGSGSSWRRPEDVRGALGSDGEGFLDQLKFTDRDAFRVDGAELERILANALRDGREGRLIIDFERRGIRLTGYIERI